MTIDVFMIIWCDDEWASRLDDLIKNMGMGFLAVHCGIADIPKDHFITKNILKAFFITHPPQYEVLFEPIIENEITEGVNAVTFSTHDEHYQIEIMVNTEILGYTVSQHGKQSASSCKRKIKPQPDICRAVVMRFTI